MIEAIAKHIPERTLNKSGSVFYSGRNAYQKESPIYLLGVNPGGDPVEQSRETVQWHTNKVINEMPDDWSAYRDESWKGAAPGTWGMQPRVLHMLNSLGLKPGEVPASNIVFQRSTRESTFAGEFLEIAMECWDLHESVIRLLDIKTVVCFGQTAGKWVRERLESSDVIGQFVEANKRQWRSQAFASNSGPSIVVVTHPSIADWSNPKTDPTNLVRAALDWAEN